MLFYICFGRILHILLSVSSCETYRYEFYMHDKPQTAYTSGVLSEVFFSPSFHGRGWAGRGACGRAAVQCLHIQRKFGLDICARTFQHLPKEHV